ncbi:MAG: HAD family hydrolase [Deltaproteobacteria bacterium]|nr:HAD family hydrolase [Deltaproteobacteria bacterium]
MSRPAVFIDRDGTINEQMGYINHPSRFTLLPRAAEAIKALNQSGFASIVVSNQSGVARGYFPLDLVHEVHGLMGKLLSKEGARLDGVFFCPHHPQGIVPEYAISCDCRKPGTGLLEQARNELDLDMGESYVIGDRCQDLEMARRAGLEGVLVLTGYGRGEREYILPRETVRPAYIAEDLLDAVRWIIDSKKQ